MIAWTHDSFMPYEELKMKRGHATVCGLHIPVMDVTSYGGGHIYPGARDIGTHARVSQKTAKRLALSVGRPRPPRPGYEMLLCEKTWLVNNAGYFEVDRRVSGGLKGRR